MPDIEISRKTYIYLSDNGTGLFPSTDLYPATDLFPNSGQLIDTIVAGTMKLDKMLYEEFRFGSFCSDKFEVTLYNTEDIAGKYIYVYQLDTDRSYIPLFTGIIESSKLDRLETDREVVAYDYAYWYRNKNVASWWSSFWTNRQTATLKQLRDSLCQYMNIAYEDVELPNDTIQITKDMEFAEISFGDMLSSICELNCAFPHFNEYGQLEFVVLNVEDTAVDIENNLEGENCSYEDYTTIPMTGVTFYDSSEEVKQTVGDSDNAYTVTSSFLLYNATATTLNSIAEVMIDYLSYFTFNPCSLKLIVSDYTLRLGDYINTPKGNCYALQIAYEGSMLIDQTVSCPGEQNMSESMASESLESIILAERYHKLINDVEEFRSEVGKYETKTDGTIERHSSSIQQNADNISSEVRRAKRAEGDLSSRISQTASSISFSLSKNGEDTAVLSMTYTKEDGTVINLTSQQIQFSGLVEFTDLSGSGKSTINGDNITTGVISSSNGNMTIDLLNEIITATKLAVNSTNFTLDVNGNVTVKNMNCNGNIILGNPDFGYTIPLASFFTLAEAVGDWQMRLFNGFYRFNAVNDYNEHSPYYLDKRPTHYLYGFVHLGVGHDGQVLLEQDSSGNYAFYPNNTNKVSLGTSSKKWKELNVTGQVSSGSLNVANGASIGSLSTGSLSISNNTLYITSNIIKRYCTYNTETQEWSAFTHLDSEWLNVPHSIILAHPLCEYMYGLNSNGDNVFRPGTADLSSLGTGTYYWHAVHVATGGLKEHSDGKEKDVIESLVDDSELENFIMGLNPVMYTRKASETKRHHMGFIAQEVASNSRGTLGDLSLFSAYVINENGNECETYETYYDESVDDENLLWELSYTEFIAPAIAMIQKQQKKIEEQQTKINELEERLEKIESLLQKEE